MAVSDAPKLTGARVSAYRIPTESPESDGTLRWTATTLVLVELTANGTSAIGYTYADGATAHLIQDKLLPQLIDKDPMAVEQLTAELSGSVRNLGQTGISALALSAVNNALWDLKARLLHCSVATLLGAARQATPVYASGGFTSQSLTSLHRQIQQWSEDGFQSVKIKVGREPRQDAERVISARSAMPEESDLMVDANGAYTTKQALALADAFSLQRVVWFEEPVRSTDLESLHQLKERGPAGMAISAGEYGFEPGYFRRMLQAQAVDILQADATRCAGISGFMKVAALCEAFDVPLSSHCAPSIHAALCCAARPAVHLEYFHDHALIENRLFDGAPRVIDGSVAPAWDEPGLGLTFKYQDAEHYRI